MTEKQILEGNKLIVNSPFHATEYDTISKNMSKSFYLDVLKYHKSYNWLMPVIEKIEEFGKTSVEIGKAHCRITPIAYSIKTDSVEWYEMIENKANTKLEAIYLSVVDFIKWYNKQQK